MNVVRYRTSYPGNPCYPDEVSESLSLWGTFTALRTRDALSFTASQLAGHTIGLVVQHPLFASVASSGYNIPEMLYVRLPLLANGTGSVPVRTASGVQNLSYLWSVTTDKDLLISFADGTTNRILLVGATGPFLATASIAEYPAGSRINAAITGTPMGYSDVAPQFVTADIADSRFRSRINYRENLPSHPRKIKHVGNAGYRTDGTGWATECQVSGSLASALGAGFMATDAPERFTGLNGQETLHPLHRKPITIEGYKEETPQRREFEVR